VSGTHRSGRRAAIDCPQEGQSVALRCGGCGNIDGQYRNTVFTQLCLIVDLFAFYLDVYPKDGVVGECWGGIVLPKPLPEMFG